MDQEFSWKANVAKRVVFVTSMLRNGGAEKVLTDIANGLARTDWEVEIISIAYDPDISHLDHAIQVRFVLNSPESAEQGGTIAHKIRRRIRIIRRLWTALKDVARDAHIIGFLEPIAHYLWFFRHFGGPRYVLSLHTYETLYFQDMWKSRLRHWLETVLLGAACRAADCVTSPSEICALDLIANFDVPAAKVRTVQNPFDLKKVRELAAVSSDRYEVPNNTAVFVHVARLVEQKNHRLMIEACKHLRAKYSDFVVLCCGQGPERPALEALIAEAGLENHVRMLGHRTNPYALMAMARGALLTSTYEAFPLVLIEAMACGAPPIATDSPSGLKDVLSGGTGLLVPLGEPEALADAMLRLIRDDELHASLRARGLERAELYSADNAVRLWSSLLSATRTGIVFVTPQLRNGGAERVLANIASYLAARGWDVEIISLAYGRDTSQFDGDIRIHFLHDAEESAQSGGTIVDKLVRRVRLLRRLRHALRQVTRNATVIGVLEPSAQYLWILRFFGGPKYLISLHVHESIYFRSLFQNPFRHWIEKTLLTAACRASEKVILPSNGCLQDMIDNFGVPTAKLLTIQNPVDLEAVHRLAQLPPEAPAIERGVSVFVQAARLAKQKNHVLLVMACELLRARYDNFVVWCCGDGPERPMLESLIAEKGLQNHVRLLGYKDNPYALMTLARGVLLTSEYESFGLVLVEAMVCGAPPIATDCRSGPDEVLSDGAGLLVPNNEPEAFAGAMLSLIQDDALHANLRERGRMKAAQYSVENTVRLWMSLLAKVKSGEQA